MLPSPYLLMWYPMLKNSPDDASGNGNNMQNFGATWVGTAPNGGGFKFDGNTTYLSTTSINVTCPAGSNTFCAWIRWDGENLSGDGSNNWVSSRVGNYVLFGREASDGKLNYYDSYTSIGPPNIVCPTNVWFHWALRHYRVGSNTLYDIAINARTVFKSGAGNVLIDPMVFDKFYLGSDFTGGVPRNQFNGAMSDFQLWKVPLVDDDLLCVMQGFSPKTL